MLSFASEDMTSALIATIRIWPLLISMALLVAKSTAAFALLATTDMQPSLFGAEDTTSTLPLAQDTAPLRIWPFLSLCLRIVLSSPCS
jgi:hypothetical protein